LSYGPSKVRKSWLTPAIRIRVKMLRIRLNDLYIILELTLIPNDLGPSKQKMIKGRGK
jgi:hypothetical protein